MCRLQKSRDNSAKKCPRTESLPQTPANGSAATAVNSGRCPTEDEWAPESMEELDFEVGELDDEIDDDLLSPEDEEAISEELLSGEYAPIWRYVTVQQALNQLGNEIAKTGHETNRPLELIQTIRRDLRRLFLDETENPSRSSEAGQPESEACSTSESQEVSTTRSDWTREEKYQAVWKLGDFCNYPEQVAEELGVDTKTLWTWECEFVKETGISPTMEHPKYLKSEEHRAQWLREYPPTRVVPQELLDMYRAREEEERLPDACHFLMVVNRICDRVRDEIRQHVTDPDILKNLSYAMWLLAQAGFGVDLAFEQLCEDHPYESMQ